MKLSGAGRGGWSRVYIAAVDRDGLAGDEVAFRGSEKNQRPEQVLRMLVALERARLDGALARGLDVTGILAQTVSLKVKPGASVLTRMPCSPSSRASARVNAIMPPLLVT